MEPIEFQESDGTVRKLVWDSGDESVGVAPKWLADDKWEDRDESDYDALLRDYQLIKVRAQEAEAELGLASGTTVQDRLHERIIELEAQNAEYLDDIKRLTKECTQWKVLEAECEAWNETQRNTQEKLQAAEHEIKRTIAMYHVELSRAEAAEANNRLMQSAMEAGSTMIGELQAEVEKKEAEIKQRLHELGLTYKVQMDLKSEVDRYAAMLAEANTNRIGMIELVDKLKAEVARLKEALEKIKHIGNKTDGGDWDEIDEARSIARAALEVGK